MHCNQFGQPAMHLQSYLPEAVKVPGWRTDNKKLF